MFKYTAVSERAYLVLVINVLILVFHMNFTPFVDNADNILETISLTMLVYASGTKLANPEGGE